MLHEFDISCEILLCIIVMLTQAHCGVWKHHLRVSLRVPGGFPPRGQGRCGCGCRLPSPRRARPRVRGSAEEAAHQGQVFPGVAHDRPRPRAGQGTHTTRLAMALSTNIFRS